MRSLWEDRRHHSRRGSDKLAFFLSRLRASPRLVCLALAPPGAALVLYALLRAAETFTPTRPGAHGAALVLLWFWAALALRGAVGFWPRRRHLQFFIVCAALIAYGSCWETWGASEAKAWVTPPVYARLPTEPLEGSRFGRRIDILAGSLVHVSHSGRSGSAVAVLGDEEKPLEEEGAGEATVSFAIPQEAKPESLTLFLRRGFKRLGLWHLRLVPDAAPRIAFTEAPQVTTRKTVRFAYAASDDYGVEKIIARLAPAASSPKAGEPPVEIVLSQPGLKETRGAGYADLTLLPWAGLRVTAYLIAVDGAGNRSFSAPQEIELPSRVFRNPFARALIEERQKLLGQPDGAARDEAASVMAGIARQQGLYRGDPVVLMALRAAAVRLVLNKEPSTVEAVRDMMWQTAIRLEEGALGLARGRLALAERDVSSALEREMPQEAVAPLFARMEQALAAYFLALENERARQPTALQGVEWPLAGAGEVLSAEDMKALLTEARAHSDRFARQAAREKLARLQGLIENLRTTPPELTPDQYKLVEQTSLLRALVRGQKNLLEETALLLGQENKTPKGRKARRDGLARLLSRQQVLLAALREASEKVEPVMRLEAKSGERAMEEAARLLQEGDLSRVQQKQAEALALMENSLLTLAEKMRQALAAETP